MKKFILFFIATLLSWVAFSQSPIVALVQNTYVEPPAQPEFILGITDDTYYTSTTGLDNIRGVTRTATEDSYFKSVSFYHAGLTNVNECVVAIYTDDGANNPQNLLAQSNVKVGTDAGWNTLLLQTEVFIPSGTKFWMIFGGQNIQGKFIADPSNTRFSSGSNYDFYGGVLPDPMPTYSTANFDYAVYGTYTKLEPFVDPIILTVNSTEATWEPYIEKTGNALEWTATGLGVNVLNQTANNPVFDFSGAKGDIKIYIESSDSFNGMSIFWLWYSGVLDITYPYALTSVTNVSMRGNPSYGDNLDLSSFPNMTTFYGDDVDNTTVDLSNNPLITFFQAYSNSLTSVSQDYILNTLEGYGLSNGNIQLANQFGGDSPTLASNNSYNELKRRGWTIDVPSPNAPDINQLLVDGDFSDPTSWIIAGTNSDITNGIGHILSISGEASFIYQTPVEDNKTYDYSFDAYVPDASLIVTAGQSGTPESQVTIGLSGWQSYLGQFTTTTASNSNFMFRRSGAMEAFFANAFFKEAQPEIYAQDNAASIINEQNSVAGWTYDPNNTISTSADAYNGDYSLAIVNTNGTVSTRREYDFNGIDGATYDIEIWAKSISGSQPNQGFVAWLGFDSFTAQYMNGATEWTPFRFRLTADGFNQKIRVYPSSSSSNAALNDEIRFDNMSIRRTYDVFPQDNAVSEFNEQNSLGAFTELKAGTVTVDTDSPDGDYSIKITNGALTYNDALIDLTNLKPNKEYTISFLAKCTSVSGEQRFIVNLGTGWTANVSATLNDTDWKRYEITATTDGTASHILRWNGNRTTLDPGNEMWFDDVEVIETPTNYSLVNATWASITLDVATQTPEQIFWIDGKLITVDSSVSQEWTLAESSDLSAAVLSGVTGTPNQARTGYQISYDGVNQVSGNFVSPPDNYHGTLSTPYNISTLTGNTLINEPAVAETRGWTWSEDGTKMYITQPTLGTVLQYSLSTPWSGTATLVNTLDVSANQNLMAGILFSPDGKYFYYGNRGSDSIDQWVMTTPWDISTATFDLNLDLDVQTSTIYDLCWFGENKMLILDTTLNIVGQIDLNN